MATLFVRHKVTDYTAWKRGYDEFASLRKEGGVSSDGIYQLEGDPNDLTVYHEFASVAAAKAFSEDPRLQQAMQQLGVQGQPQIWITNRV
jgi:hypothetical protein